MSNTLTHVGLRREDVVRIAEKMGIAAAAKARAEPAVGRKPDGDRETVLCALMDGGPQSTDDLAARLGMDKDLLRLKLRRLRDYGIISMTRRGVGGVHGTPAVWEYVKPRARIDP